LIADRTLIVLAGLTLLLVPACGKPESPPTAAPPCPPQNERFCAAATGDLLDVRLADLKPTQPSLGYDEVYYRLGRHTLGPDPRRELLDAWCATNGQTGLKSAGTDASITNPASFDCAVAVGSETPESTAAMKTGVIGPGGQVYLTDGHHTLTSFWEAPGGGPETRIRLKITGNMSTLEMGNFWRQMQDRGWTWLQDVNGKPVEPQQLPAGLGLKQFANDQYRGTLYFVRDVGYGQDDDSPAFQEFYWGQWLRSQTDPGLQPADFSLTEMPSYLTLVGNIGKAIVALPADTEIANSRDAAELGKLDAFGEKAFEALSQPVDTAKPGKLALALAYKKTR
jgi:hypothetical protein